MEVSLLFERITCVLLNPVKDKDSGAWELEPFRFPCFYFVEPSRCLSAFLMPTTHSPTTILRAFILAGVGRPMSFTPPFSSKSPSLRRSAKVAILVVLHGSWRFPAVALTLGESFQDWVP
jgi:hypothetical protein